MPRAGVIFQRMLVACGHILFIARTSSAVEGGTEKRAQAGPRAVLRGGPDLSRNIDPARRCANYRSAMGRLAHYEKLWIEQIYE
jgi:hypothetical protein